VTFFTATADEASQLLALTARRSADAYSRRNPQWNSRQAFGGRPPGFASACRRR
jgi:allophanate hydrolase